MDHTGLWRSYDYMTVDTRRAITSALLRVDALMAMTRQSTDDKELFGWIETLWETGPKTRSAWGWYKQARALAGNPVRDVTE